MRGEVIPAAIQTADKQAVAACAREIVMAAERDLGFDPTEAVLSSESFSTGTRLRQDERELRPLGTAGRAHSTGSDRMKTGKTDQRCFEKG